MSFFSALPGWAIAAFVVISLSGSDNVSPDLIKSIDAIARITIGGLGIIGVILMIAGFITVPAGVYLITKNEPSPKK